MNLNVILRGQSNALLFGVAENGAVLGRLAQDVRQLLGFDGTTDTVTVHFAYGRSDGANTVNSGTAFLSDWIGPQGAGWAVRPLEQGILNYVRGLPAGVRDDPTAVLWFHSEFDSRRWDLTAGEWESGVRFDAGLLRAALGQSASNVPYLFVSAHPYWGTDQGHQAIRQGMENLAADAGFNADIAARILDVNANYDNAGEYGGSHLSDSDQRVAEARMARALAETWAAHAKPGSPVALAAGNIDDHGPRVAEAAVVGANQLSLRFAFDGASRLQTLDPDAAHGLGWSVRSDGGELAATSAALSGTDTLLLTFNSAIPAGGKLFYGYGYGRLAQGNTPGQGNAVYDEQGMPVWVAAGGLAVTGGGAAPPPPSTQPANPTVGSGPDRLVLSVSQDVYQGSAQYTVQVDGVQVGGTLTASALHSSGQRDTVTVLGDWAGGRHTATVTFLNDAWGGTAAADRNLYVDGAAYNGAALPGAAALLWGNGPANIAFTDSDPVAANPSFPPATRTVGSGDDRLVLSISQDQYQGSAQYTVQVDGVQIGGTLTASALRSAGQRDTVTVLGDWAGGAHAATVTFLNDAWGGTAAADRNLYVDGAAYNGATVAGAAASLMAAGPARIAFTDLDPPPLNTPPPPAGGSQPANPTVGSGPDRLVLSISQDVYQGPAQYTVQVDGVQVGGTLTASALHSSGQRDTVTVLGDWAGGRHTATVTFLNDAWGGTAAADRNLYVDGAAYNGATVAGAAASLMAAGPANLVFTDSDPVAANTGFAPASRTVGSGPDRLVLFISQDAYQGSAQYTVQVDGVQIGGTLTASALHASGQSDTVTVLGNWNRGDHAVVVRFLNDAWGGSAATDRNLHVDGATYNGAAVPGAAQGISNDWRPGGFSFLDPLV